MKKLILFILLLVPFFAMSQKIQNIKTREVCELKDKVSAYCAVTINLLKPNMGYIVMTDELEMWCFIDGNNAELVFKTPVAVMNHMHKNGWEYINNIGGSDGSAPQYYFKKIQPAP